jgi:hypothetical protein
MDASAPPSRSTGFSLCGVGFDSFHQTKTTQAEACATKTFGTASIRGQCAEEEAWRGVAKCASLLDSAPSDSSDDSGPVLAKPPNRLGRTAIGDFGGRFLCTFRSGLRSSSDYQPGYYLLPHLYQELHHDNTHPRAGSNSTKTQTDTRPNNGRPATNNARRIL